MGQPYFHDKSVFDRGHLTPFADFAIPAAKLLTMHYINTRPMTGRVNKDKVQRCERMTRRLAIKLKAILEVWTGSYGLMELPKVFPKPLFGKQKEAPVNVPLYMAANKQVAVPDWIYKIVLHKERGLAIVFLVRNNIFPDTISEKSKKPPCEDVCDQANMQFAKNEIRFGQIICCTYKGFVDSLGYLDPFLALPVVKGLLKLDEKYEDTDPERESESESDSDSDSDSDGGKKKGNTGSKLRRFVSKRTLSMFTSKAEPSENKAPPMPTVLEGRAARASD